VLLDATYGPLSMPARVAALAGAFGLAAVSYHFLEHPVRESRWLSFRPRRSLALGGALVAMGVLAATIVIALPHDLGSDGGVAAAPTLPGQAQRSTSDPAAPQPTGTDPTTGASGTPGTGIGDDGPGNTDPSSTTVPPAAAPESLATLIAAQRPALDQAAALKKVPSNATPPVAIATGDKPRIYRENCVIKEGSVDPGNCVYGDTSSTTVIALFGDSHAAQWFPALEQLSLQHHWKLLVYVKSGCPTADVRIRKTYLDQECVVWRRNVAARLAGDHPTLLVMSSTFYDPGGSDKSVPQDVAWRRGLTTTLDAVRPAVQQLLILGDTPLPAHEIPNCLAANPRSVRHCITTRGPAIKLSRLQLESDLATTYRADFVSTSDWLCGTRDCPVVIGNIVMYRDNNHVSATMSRYLAPFVQAAILPLLP
jgi:hypothetical protein